MNSLAYKDSYIPVLDDGRILTTVQGGPHLHRSALEAEHHAKQYQRGWVGNAIPADREDVI